MANYYLPGFAGELSSNSSQEAYEQRAPLFNLYSPRLFGAPPQLTHQCDMRLKSSLGTHPGPVGDFYLDNVLRDAQVANFIIGHARFTGGMSSLLSLIQTSAAYATALKRYKIFDNNGQNVTVDQQTASVTEYALENYDAAMGTEVQPIEGMKTDEVTGTTGVSSDSYTLDLSAIEGAENLLQSVANMLSVGGVLLAPLKDAAAMQLPFYRFEADWNSYINNVKMMINTAITMLGLNDAKVRIGDQIFPLTANTVFSSETDVWTNYRFITPTADSKVGDVNAIDTLSGETNQYVSFMIEPAQVTENYTNETGESTIYSSVIQSGSPIGNEIAFITNTTRNSVDDALLDLSGQAVNLAEKLMSNLSMGTGRFTASVLGSMAKSYTGEHTIYPKIFQRHSSTQSVSLTIKLRASAGDPYSYLMEILVPIFHLMAMAIPQMAKNAASAYSYPPLVQLNIPGVWGTKLGIIQSLQFNKSNNDLSVNGYPLAVDVSVTVEDLQHTIMSSGMDKPHQMLNNDTMFDYIAQCAGVDKYRWNPAVRIVSKIMLAASSGRNSLHNLGSALLNDGTSLVNRWKGIQNL